MAEPVPERILRMLWWRASIVTMEAAAVNSEGSERRWAAPKYAPTPTFSTRRAAAAKVGTSVKTLEKSNWHPLIVCPPRELITD